ncbi:heme peroxidase [Xylariomycetidae sp. FL2044]|nr:heme peroxidase [Xylariomycetidae sp. FL2044]
MKPSTVAALGLLQASQSAAEYVWPSKWDYLEDVMNLQTGYIRQGFIDAVSPCSFGTNIAGRQNAAEWLRTAYHDMSTHDASSGTGGLDASLMFELGRDENIGSSFNNTFGFMKNYYSTKTSMSDLLGLSVIAATTMCGGPDIQFRPGRVDATEAGPMGVPKPEEDIDRHTEIFAKAGFNTTDMITMVACGHTLGGIHGANFPEITLDTSEGQVSRFEGDNNSTSFAEFDNVVITQYLDGTTENLLVVGTNDTTNSDKRVFAADGNETMNALADAEVFQAKCADILGRMIDTVPSTVTLEEPLQPIDIKPYVTALALNGNGTISFEGRIRVRVSPGADRSSGDLEAHLTFADRAGTNTSAVIATTHPTLKGGTSTGLFGEIFSWYEFATALDASRGISKFHVHLTTPSTGATTVHDNGGRGFPVDDAVLYQRPQSCLNITIVDGAMDLTVVAAVRADRAEDDEKEEALLTLELVHKVPRQGVIVPALEVRPTAFERTAVEKRSGYVLFRAHTPIAADSWSTTFDVVLGEGDARTAVEDQKTTLLTEETCAAL